MRIKIVEFIPEEIENNILYFSPEFSTGIHLCMCGCGNKVVTPFSKSDWKLIFEESFTIRPSIGNWNFKCRSHYWIRNGKVVWCEEEDLTIISNDIQAGKIVEENIKENRFMKWLNSLKDIFFK